MNNKVYGRETAEAKLNEIRQRFDEGLWTRIWYYDEQLDNADILGLSETDVEVIIEEIKKQKPNIKQDSLYSFGTAMKSGIKYYETHNMTDKAIDLCIFVMDSGLLPLDTFFTWKLKKLGCQVEDVMLKEYNVAYHRIEEQKKINLADNLYGLYRNCLLDEYELNIKNKFYDKAFYNLSEILYIDLSGVDNGFTLRSVERIMKYSFPYINEEGRKSLSTIPPAAEYWIKDIMVRLSLSEEEFKTKLVSNMNTFNLPFHYFTIEECADICVMELHHDEAGLMRLYDKAYERNKESILNETRE